jgi:hypothetical protein
MSKVETPRFVRHAVANPDSIGPAVSVALRSDYPYDTSTAINYEALLQNGPDWFRQMKGYPIERLHKLNSTPLWSGIIERSGFELSMMDERLAARRLGNNPELAGSEITARTRNGFGSVLPMFGIAAVMGERVQESFTFRAYRTPVAEAVVGAGIDIKTTAETPEEFLERLKRLFPERILHADRSAFSYLLVHQSFGRDTRCPASGLTKQILEAFGKELRAGFDRELITQPQVNEALLL